MKTILITGAAGYLASSLIDLLLQKNYKVVGFDNNWKSTADTLLPYITNDNFEFVLGDITDNDDMSSLFDRHFDVIVHMAAIVGAPACKKHKMVAMEVNVNGTYDLLSWRDGQSQAMPLIYCNTGSIYKGGLGICNEYSPVDPQSHYALTKYMAEEYVVQAKNTITHRYATAAGLSKNNMRVNLLANDLTIQAVRNKSLTLFESDFMRTFIHCRDIASAIVFTIENFSKMHSFQKIYNVGNPDQNYTKRQLAEIIKSLTGCHLNFAETEKDPDQRDYGYDQSAIMSFGWKPVITIKQTLRELIKAVPLLSTFDKYR